MTTTPEPLRFLLVGCGGIVTNAHLPAFEEFPDRLQLVGITDPSSAARAAVAERLKKGGAEPQSFASFDEALSTLKDQVDAVLITTPHFLHYPQAKACVEAGLPVLVEKPVCNNAEEMKDLYRAAQKQDTLVVAGQNRRYDRKARWIKNWLEEHPEQFGELRSFDMRGWQNIEAWIATKPDPDADFWILDKERAGGGVVVSLLVHYLDIIRYLTGLDFVEVSAKGRYDAPFKNGAESSCSAILTLSNGAVGTMHANYLARKIFHPGEVFNLIGDQGYIGNEQGWKTSTTHGEKATGWAWQYEGATDVPLVESLTPHPSSFVSQLLSFAEAVKTGIKPMSHLQENFNTMATVDAIAQSMRANGAPTPVETL